jgi:hypothetical protein
MTSPMSAWAHSRHIDRNAAGLPELITYITEEYEQTALALALEPHTPAAIRSKLAPLDLQPV